VINSGNIATLGVPLTVAGTPPAGLEWKIAFSPTQISALSVTSGPAATAAVKTLSCSSGSGTNTCLVAGTNANAIGSGVVAYLNATMAPGVTSASIQISNTLGADSSGNAVDINSEVNSQTINVTTGGRVSGVACNPASLGPGAAATCTVTLPQSAPSGGSSVSLSSNNDSLSVPSSVTVAEGATSADFKATAAGTITSNQTATVSANIDGSSQSASINLVAPSAPVTLSRISCDPYILIPGAGTTCTVTLTSAANSGGAVVALSSSNSRLSVPGSVTIPEGATQVTFSTNAGFFFAIQNVILTATLNGNSTTTSLTLTRNP